VSVKFVGAKGCESERLARICSELEGKWLDEVDLDALREMGRRDDRCCGCPEEAARKIGAIREVLLPEQAAGPS